MLEDGGIVFGFPAETRDFAAPNDETRAGAQLASYSVVNGGSLTGDKAVRA
jgi:hypothetical protein